CLAIVSDSAVNGAAGNSIARAGKQGRSWASTPCTRANTRVQRACKHDCGPARSAAWRMGLSMDEWMTDLQGKVCGGCGHWGQFKRPAVGNQALPDFLKTVS